MNSSFFLGSLDQVGYVYLSEILDYLSKNRVKSAIEKRSALYIYSMMLA
jgi:hypothetical protein